MKYAIVDIMGNHVTVDPVGDVERTSLPQGMRASEAHAMARLALGRGTILRVVPYDGPRDEADRLTFIEHLS